jgi:hypothetical protein
LVATGDCQRRIEAEAGCGLDVFVSRTRSDRIVKAESDIRTRTAAHLLPDTSGQPPA